VGKAIRLTLEAHLFFRPPLLFVSFLNEISRSFPKIVFGALFRDL